MAVNPTDATEVVPYLTSGITIFVLQQWMKRREWYATFVSKFPGLDKWAHWVIAGTMSFVASTGIHWVWQGSLMAGGIIQITVPQFWTLVHGVSDWYKVYILQHGMYVISKTPAYHHPVPPTGDA